MLIFGKVMTQRLFIILSLLIGAFSPALSWAESFPAIEQDKTAAVILAYHRIGEDYYPATNIRQAQFESHIRELRQGRYNIIALPDLVRALDKGDKLPPRTIALTFDGAHRSAYEIAIPLLLEYDIPFTLFLPTDLLDSALPHYITWRDIKKLQRHKNVTLGLHPATYKHLNETDPDELRRAINKARTRLREETGLNAAFFAYPFGEWDARARKIISEQGFTAAFAEQSGVAYSGHDPLTLPRFPMTENYAGLDRFRLIANTLPLPISDLTPTDPALSTASPAIGFSLPDATLAARTDRLSCFISGQEKAQTEKVGENRVELRIPYPFEDERNRVNCTMPAPPQPDTGEPRWRWLGALFILRQAPAEEN